MNNRIQFGEPVLPEIMEEEFPPEILLTGSEEKFKSYPFRVYMLQEVYAEIWAHVSKTPDIESGGVLVGYPFSTFDGQTTFIVITAAIPQHSQDRSGGHFTVGPVQIAEARRKIEHHYPGLIAVGWYHSHPGHGVFLSGQDMTIVSSIYDAPWHLALVIDPQRYTEGLFIGPEGRQIGRRGDQQRGMSWIGLRDVPDGVKAIALYNQVRDWLQDKNSEAAHDVLNQLYSLVESSPQLSHWRERGEYRDLEKLSSEIENSPRQQSLSADEQVKPRQSESYKVRHPRPSRIPPEPARRTKDWSSIHWLIFSGILAICFAVFVLVAVFRGGGRGHQIELGWGILLSFLAIVLAGHVIFSREGIEPTQSDLLRAPTHALHLASERFMALFIVALVLIVWVIYNGYAIFIPPTVPSISPDQPTLTVFYTPVPATVLSTVTTTAATATSTHTPSLTPTFPPTDTPTLSPMPTETLTPTYIPTWTPTATSTITLSETTIPTSTDEVTSTNSITPQE
jgi:proteasome lid subunit RPN8/RPN11